jgi:hypothetical protein
MGRTFYIIIQSDILSTVVDALKQNISMELARWSL